VLVSKSLPHESSNSPPWIFYNQFFPWCFLTYKEKFSLFNLPPKEHGMYWSRIRSVTSCQNDRVVLRKPNPPGIVPNPHKFLFFLYLPWDLTSAVLLFHLDLKVLCLTGPCHLFHLGSSSLQTRLQEFIILVVPMRTTFPIWKLEYTRPPEDLGPDDICPLSLLSSETLSCQTNRACHSRQIFIS